MIHVVAAALVDPERRVLLTQRPPGRDFAGSWEFPGGKREAGESPLDALARELHEELGIAPLTCAPLIRIPCAYPDKRLLLDVYRVDAYRGELHGREGQALRWTPISALDRSEMPPADHPAVTALQLPEAYLVTPEPGPLPDFLARLDAALERGLRLVQVRAKTGPDADWVPLLRSAQARVRAQGGRLLVNARIELARTLGLDGVHLTARQVAGLSRRPLAPDAWVGASCHDAAELARAVRLGADFAVLGPVRPTPSHPGAPSLGWERFAALVADCPLPVYALGGLGPADLATARAAGAQGVAGISGLW